MCQPGAGKSPPPPYSSSELSWAAGTSSSTFAGLVPPRPGPSDRKVTLLQRKPTKPGASLGKTTGWIHRAALKARGVEMRSGVRYERIDEKGLAIALGKDGSQKRLLEVDTVVLCAGQEPLRDLLAPLQAANVPVHLAGGADVAAELDAKRAIEQGTLLAARI